MCACVYIYTCTTKIDVSCMLNVGKRIGEEKRVREGTLDGYTPRC